jgi:hypothetical protein
MAWISILPLEAHTGTRPVSIIPPITARSFLPRIPWSTATRLEPHNRIQCMGWREKLGTANTTRTPLQNFPFATAGDPDTAANEIPGLLNPIPILNMLGNERLAFEVTSTNENGSAPTECGLQVVWFDGDGNQLDGSGNIDDNPAALPPYE